MEVKPMMENNYSILIVDDDENIRKSLKTILEQEGYKVDVTKNGQEAIQMSKKKFFNIALLDVKLPDMEGTKLLTAMHTNFPKTMKIMITGYPALENSIEALNRGADAYLKKPFTPKALIELVEKKLQEQSHAEKITEEQVTEWVETRVRKYENDPKES